MLFTLVTPFMALLAAVQADVVTVHDSVTITEDLTETVTITNCGTKSCHPASYVTYTSGSQEIVSCPTGGILTSHDYSAPTIVSEPVETSTSTKYTRTRTHTRHHSRHSHYSSLASAESVYSASISSAPYSSEGTSVTSHRPHVVSSSAEHSAYSMSAPGSPGATGVSHSSHIAESSAVKPAVSESHVASSSAEYSHSVSAPYSSAPGSSGVSSVASPTSSYASSSAASAAFSEPVSPSYVPPAHNTTSAEICITCSSSEVPSDRSTSASTTTLCAGAGCSPQIPTSRTASYVASTGSSSGSYNVSCSLGVMSASTSAVYTARSSSILPAAYNTSSTIVSNASCINCAVEVTPITSVPQGTLSSESNQEATAYVDVTTTRYLNSSSAVLHSYVSSDIGTKSFFQPAYSNRSNSSVSTIPSVSSYQGGASSMKAAGFGAVLGAALIAIM